MADQLLDQLKPPKTIVRGLKMTPSRDKPLSDTDDRMARLKNLLVGGEWAGADIGLIAWVDDRWYRWDRLRSAGG